MQIVEDAISRYFFLAAWAGLYLALSYASEAHRVERRADRLERAAQQAELRSLRYQVNPHFLFNTLNSLSRSEEHTSELQSLMRISYAVFCLKKKKMKEPPH